MLATLRDAYADGRLSAVTLSFRIDAALNARTHGDLSRTLADLGVPAVPLAAWARMQLRAFGAGLRRQAPPKVPPPGPLVLPREPVQRLIGRATTCDLILADDAVSRRHALLCPVDDGWELRDLDSTNGTFVNAWRLRMPTAVRPGDVVTFGRVSFRLT